MTFVVDERATRIARLRHVRGVDRLNALFGVLIDHDADGHALPPPARVMVALMGQGARLEGRNPESGKFACAHGARGLRRRAKRARYALNTRRGEHRGWQAFGEEAKRRASAGSGVAS